MMKARIGRDYTHFIGVLVSPSLAGTVESCRAWMTARYGCSSGYLTAPHITLVPPFVLPDNVQREDILMDGEAPEKRLERVIGEWAGAQSPFSARVRGFGAFAHRTIYARVENDDRWSAWQRGVSGAIADAFPGMLPAARDPYTPHLTVANRDIPETGFMDALAYFAELDLDEEFPVDHVVLFERRKDRWEVRAGWEVYTYR